jgi:hypothetical protein
MDRSLQFRLAGRNFSLDRRRIEDVVKNLSPGPIDKYFVRVDGRIYPPKQVIAAALQIPPGDFITTDATRVLRNLGYKIERQTDNAVEKPTSEQLFEEYLKARGLLDFRFEPNFTKTLKRPDYTLVFRGQELLFEVNEFRATAEDFRPGFGHYDPYGPIREKINAAREKFKNLNNYPCSLVLYNGEKPLVDLGWQMIYGAMLGNLAIRMPFDPQRRALSEMAETGFFGGGGKMVRYTDKKPIEPQNQTISAIVVLEQSGVGRRRFEIELRRKEVELGRDLTWEEHYHLIDQMRGTECDASLTQLRVVVCENPYALSPLRRDIFLGPYDERYGASETGAQVVRLSVGEQLERLEALAGPQKSVMRRIAEESERSRQQTKVRARE